MKNVYWFTVMVLSVSEQIAAIEQMINVHPNLRGPLELRKRILEAQREARDNVCKGTSVDWSNRSVVNELQQKAFISKEPIASFLDPSIFDTDVLSHMCTQIVHVLINSGVKEEELKGFLGEMKSKKLKLVELVDAALRMDADFFEGCGGRLGVRSSIILFVTDMLIQPCLEEIACKIGSSFFEGWWRQASCPVCGRRPIVAKLKARKRYLICSLCGVEYLTDLFLCVNCGNVDPYTLKFLAPGEHPKLRVDFCEKCRHYVKVIHEDELNVPIPKGLEDIMTLDLDLMAKHAELVRV